MGMVKSLRSWFTSDKEEKEFFNLQMKMLTDAKEAGLIEVFENRPDAKFLNVAHSLAELACFREWLANYFKANKIKPNKETILKHTNIDMFAMFYNERLQIRNKVKEEKEKRIKGIRIKSGLEQPDKPENNKTKIKKYSAKHYVLAYLFECNVKGESYPIGNKKELERIGNKRMGAGKGNRFYKVFNEVINKDLNAEKNLFEIGGECWRKAVIELSESPEIVENYLKSKQL
jgi:hypothetical protein